MADPVLQAVSETVQVVLTDTCLGGDAIGLDSAGNWVKADADAATPIRAEFFALHRGAASGDPVTVARRVILYDSDAPYTKGALQYLSGTAGKHTQTNPVGNAFAVQVLGKALSTEQAYLDADIPHLVVPFQVQGADAATAANYGGIFVADRNWRLVAAREAHRTAGTDAGAVILDIEKLTSGQAEDAGVSMLAATFNLKGTANTPVAAAPTATVANARLKPGDRVALKDAGVLTAVADVHGALTFVEDL